MLRRPQESILLKSDRFYVKHFLVENELHTIIIILHYCNFLQIKKLNIKMQLMSHQTSN